MKLRARLDEKRNRYHAIDEELEDVFVSANPKDIVPGCKVVVSYKQVIINCKIEKSLEMAFHKNDNDTETRNEAIVDLNKMLKDVPENESWEKLKQWAEWFGNEQDLKIRIIEKNKKIEFIY